MKLCLHDEKHITAAWVYVLSALLKFEPKELTNKDKRKLVH